jgi:hypothetical protein
LAVAYGIGCCDVLIGRGFDLARHLDLGDVTWCAPVSIRRMCKGASRVAAAFTGGSRPRMHMFLIARLYEVGRPLPRMLDRHV